MIGFHFQKPIDRWPEAAAVLPNHSVIKAIDNVQMLHEARGYNPTFFTVLRHHVAQNLPANVDDFKDAARVFFRSFIDDHTFRSLAKSVSAVQHWNEYYGNGQPAEEKARWVLWDAACVEVWNKEYRSQADYAHIKLILAETAVGNDIPIEVAKLAWENDCILGYHPYVPVSKGEIMPGEWEWYSGRWTKMDERYRARGYKVEWFFGEGGPVRDNAPWRGELAPGDGWRHRDALGGQIDQYLRVMEYWCQKTEAWNRVHGYRARGATLFTSGGGDRWKWFETRHPEIVDLARLAAKYPPKLPSDTKPPIDPPDPPVDPAAPPAKVNHAIHLIPQDTSLDELTMLTEAFHPTKSAFTYSADVAHAVMYYDTNKEGLTIWEPERWGGADIVGWFDRRGIPSVTRRFEELTNPKPPTLWGINFIVDELPRHLTKKYGQRAVTEVDTIVVHHSAGSLDVVAIANYHVSSNDWPGIGYHFCIHPDGRIDQTQRLTTRSYHAGGHNDHTVGICLLGNFMKEPPTGEALEALDLLLDYLMEGELVNADTISPHRALVQTACPGDTWEQWWIW
ncbi:MAG: N-acetylmuramoyl-L-alanine amidase [Anaerolineae bacterium]|nr:N-acetylmuramoyl-L-alanine amidase [Anaerolineae bacterium]